MIKYMIPIILCIIIAYMWFKSTEKPIEYVQVEVTNQCYHRGPTSFTEIDCTDIPNGSPYLLMR